MATQRKPQPKSKTPEQDRYDPDRSQRTGRVMNSATPPSDEEYMQLGDDDIPDRASETRRPDPQRQRKSPPKPRVSKSNGHMTLPWNNIVAEGTVFGDPELRVNDEGEVWLATFSLAIYNGKFNNGEYRPSIWIQVKVKGDKAIVVDEEISDRCRVHVEGRLDQYKTEDGRYLNSIICDFFEVTRR